MSIYEIGMLVCFGFAWPFSIYKSFVSRTTKGKSLFFLVVVFLGYVSGILNKYLVHYDNVVYFYYANTLMVFLDIVLFARNSFLEKQ